MGGVSNPIFFITCLIFTWMFFAINANENEVSNEHPFNYLGRTNKGPENWAQIKPEWETCGTGKFQSPIDIFDHEVEILPSLGKLNKTYKPAPAAIRNRGHDIMVEWRGDAGGLIINGSEYKLLQCHWHTPSEHTLNGQSLKMELHMVHNNSQGEIAVVGILYKLGHPDPFLEKFLEHMNSATNEGTDLGVVDPWEIKFGSRKYFRYFGSLTVPPCTEGIVWTIIKKVRTVSIEQIRALRNAVHDGFEENSRPTQDLKGRTVYMYHP
ncbi:hypothetical protein BUALT_Bualt16G0117300 [Buddleja alternifolia]|uniref:carbonic anhydrase n=1 Tax=Buddleja alternifolia TaxID=168488 RepID=A0AAV6WHC7_9LAMI|nr:hypothetical protein BUALT_Bualt16G0117300 [Buddleja alternifolia]